MIKKERVKGMVFGIILTLMLVGTVGVFASGQVSENIKILYNDIKLVIDGKPTEFGKDSAGKDIEPFIYNGTTYLPVRAVGEALGENVYWDGETQTVYLGEKPGAVNYLTEIIEPYQKKLLTTYKLDNSKKLRMGGVEYKTGYRFTNSYSSASNAYFNLNSQYNTIEGYVGAMGASSGKFNIYLDGSLYKTVDIDHEKLPEKLSIPVKGVNQIKLETDGYSFNVGFGDIIIK